MPDLSAFNDAVQVPALYHQSLGDIRNGQLLCNALGLPVPSSGNFAVVYQTSSQGKKHALRCFIKPAADQEERFRYIAEHLQRYPCAHFVDFQFHSQGLLVGGHWQPLMVMEWRDGTPLETHIVSLLGDSSGLLDLAGQWADMFDHLRSIDIAHGDIHPDNVIVSGGKLCLIDYDAIYVPTLAGRSIQEAGQRNFQHPQRNAGHYGPYMDHFPAWVVYYSLILLSIEPELWTRFQGGDQKLLFTAEDFKTPTQSAMFQHLDGSPIAIFQLISCNMRAMLANDLTAVPVFSRSVVQAGGLPLPPQPPLWWIKPQGVSDWWRDHVEKPAAQPKNWLRKR